MSYYWKKTAFYLAAFVTVIIVGAMFLSPYRSMIGLIVYGLVLLGGLFLLVNWHARTFAYRCPDRGHVFEITTWKDLVSLHRVDKKGGWKYTRSPVCGRRMKARIIPKVHLKGF